jgi:hypothetical protein
MTKKERTEIIMKHSKNAEIFIYQTGKPTYEYGTGIRLTAENIEDIHHAMIQIIIQLVDNPDKDEKITMSTVFKSALTLLHMRIDRNNVKLMKQTAYSEDLGKNEDDEKEPFEFGDPVGTDRQFDYIWDKQLSEIEQALEEKKMTYKNPKKFTRREKKAWLKKYYPDIYNLFSEIEK